MGASSLSSTLGFDRRRQFSQSGALSSPHALARSSRAMPAAWATVAQARAVHARRRRAVREG